MAVHVNQPVIVYLHIYKTGGSSVRELLARTFDGHDFIDVSFYDRCGSDGLPRTLDGADEYARELVDLARANQHILRYVAADVPHGFHRHLDVPVWYCATLRDPVQRLLSYVRFARRDPETSIWPLLTAADFDFERLVREHRLYAFHNDQVRMLSGSARVELGADDLDTAKDRIASGEVRVAPADGLERLRREIERDFAVVAPPVPRLNATDPTMSDFLGDEAIRQLRNLNELDAELWRWYSATYR